jgi:superfamily II DNA or RNA helicase
MTRDERQKLGIKKWIQSGCKGTLQWATGTGKTKAAIIAIRVFLAKNRYKKIVVVVPTEYLKVQWSQELSRAGFFNEVDVEIINSAIKSNEKVDFLILDEAHRIPSDTFYAVFSNRNPTLVLGLSATFNRLDGRHALLDKFCPVCDVIEIKEAVKNKWLSPYKEYKVILEVEDIGKYNEWNRQFNESFSVFNYDFQLALRCLTNIIDRRRYAKIMGINNSEMDAIVFTWNRALKARKKFITDHPKKVDITRKILQARPFSKAITFSATIKQAEKIGGGAVVHSGKTKRKNRITLSEFSRYDTGVIHTAKSLDEGADIEGLNLAIILCNTSSQTQKTQRIGRVIRYQEGKEAEIFTLVIRGTSEENWYNTSTAGKSYIEITEQELDSILNYEEIEQPEQIAKESQFIFRL